MSRYVLGWLAALCLVTALGCGGANNKVEIPENPAPLPTEPPSESDAPPPVTP